jgi:hypothetical protein
MLAQRGARAFGIAVDQRYDDRFVFLHIGGPVGEREAAFLEAKPASAVADPRQPLAEIDEQPVASGAEQRLVEAPVVFLGLLPDFDVAPGSCDGDEPLQLPVGRRQYDEIDQRRLGDEAEFHELSGRRAVVAAPHRLAVGRVGGIGSAADLTQDGVLLLERKKTTRTVERDRPLSSATSRSLGRRSPGCRLPSLIALRHWLSSSSREPPCKICRAEIMLTRRSAHRVRPSAFWKVFSAIAG